MTHGAGNWTWAKRIISRLQAIETSFYGILSIEHSGITSKNRTLERSENINTIGKVVKLTIQWYLHVEPTARCCKSTNFSNGEVG
jgi:hypothetical protein